jgi:Domain of unknown function (DUF4270)
MPLLTKWRGTAGAALMSAALAVLTLACDPPSEVGLDVLPVEVPVGATYQELPATASTVLRNDSVLTANKNNFLVGRLRDVKVGTTTAEAFFQLSPLTNNLTEAPAAGSRADSLVLFLSYLNTGQIYGSADARQTLEVRELDEFFTEDKAYFASSSLATKPQVLGSNTVKHRYTTTAATTRVPEFPWIDGDTNTVKAPATRVLAPLRIKLIDGTLKETLFAKLGTPDMASASALQAVVKGLAVRPQDGSQGAIVNFDPRAALTRMILYYHLANDTTPRQFSFSLGNAETERYFTRIQTTYADGEYLQVFDTPAADTVAPTTPEFAAVLQGGLELGVRLRLPGLEELKRKKGRIAINRAELVIPVKQYSAGVYPVPQQAYLYELDGKGKVLTTSAQPRVVQASGYSPTGTANPAIVAYDPTQRAYRVLLTTYLDSYINDKLTDQQARALMLVPTLSATASLGLNRVLLDGSLNSIQLKVYYSELN